MYHLKAVISEISGEKTDNPTDNHLLKFRARKGRRHISSILTSPKPVLGMPTLHSATSTSTSLHFTHSGRIHQSKLSRGSLQTPGVLSVRQAGMLHCQHGSSERKVSPPDKRVRHQKLQWLRHHSLSSHWLF